MCKFKSEYKVVTGFADAVEKEINDAATNGWFVISLSSNIHTVTYNPAPRLMLAVVMEREVEVSEDDVKVAG